MPEGAVVHGLGVDSTGRGLGAWLVTESRDTQEALEDLHPERMEWKVDRAPDAQLRAWLYSGLDGQGWI